MPPSAHLSTLLAPFQSLFAPTWRKVQRLLIGTILARGRRTVTAALRQHGTAKHPVVQSGVQPRWSSQGQPTSAPCWCRPSRPLAAASPSSLTKHWRAGADARLPGFEPQVPSAPVGYAGSADPEPPWSGRPWALPVLSVPAPTPQVSERLGRRHKTIAQWTRQMIRVVRRWLPNVAITVLGDQAYSVVELGHACRRCGVV